MEVHTGVFDDVRTVIAKTLDIAPETITMESELRQDLGADSLDSVETVMAVEVEDKFGITIDESIAKTVNSVGDIVRHIEAVQAATPA